MPSLRNRWQRVLSRLGGLAVMKTKNAFNKKPRPPIAVIHWPSRVVKVFVFTPVSQPRVWQFLPAPTNDASSSGQNEVQQPNFPYYNTVDQIYHAEWTAQKLARQELLRASIQTLWPKGHPTQLIHVSGTSG